jgi:hypothetical protein
MPSRVTHARIVGDDTNPGRDRGVIIYGDERQKAEIKVTASTDVTFLPTRSPCCESHWMSGKTEHTVKPATQPFRRSFSRHAHIITTRRTRRPLAITPRVSTSSPFDTKDYWEKRLATSTDLSTVGYAGLGKPFNQWMYRLRRRVFLRTVTPLVVEEDLNTVLDMGPVRDSISTAGMSFGQVTSASVTSRTSPLHDSDGAERRIVERAASPADRRHMDAGAGRTRGTNRPVHHNSASEGRRAVRRTRRKRRICAARGESGDVRAV